MLYSTVHSIWCLSVLSTIFIRPLVMVPQGTVSQPILIPPKLLTPLLEQVLVQLIHPPKNSYHISSLLLVSYHLFMRRFGVSCSVLAICAVEMYRWRLEACRAQCTKSTKKSQGQCAFLEITLLEIILVDMVLRLKELNVSFCTQENKSKAPLHWREDRQLFNYLV